MKDEDVDLLERYCSAEYSETSEYVKALLTMRLFGEAYGMTDRFSEGLDLELQHWFDRFTSEAKIVTKREPRPDLVYTELEWYDD